MFLQNFDAGLLYKRGELIPVPDTLSRAPAKPPQALHAVRLSYFITEFCARSIVTLGAVVVN